LPPSKGLEVFYIRILFLFTLAAVLITSGCSTGLSHWRQDAVAIVDLVRIKGGETAFPDEYKSAEDSLAKGEALLRADEEEEADSYFHLAWTKGKVLKKGLDAERLRTAEAARLKEETEKSELKRQRLLREKQSPFAMEQPKSLHTAENVKKIESPRLSKDKPLPAYHTVMRNETLPQIAALADVYGDQMLWPLLYRANRDQIRDPAHIWPGQVLRIPRNLNNEEIAEARRYSQEKPLR
jgi:nucleoid-associated protein YgaU